MDHDDIQLFLFQESKQARDMHKLSQVLISGVFMAKGQLGLAATMMTSNVACANESNGVAISRSQLQPVWLARAEQCPTTLKPVQYSDQCQGNWASNCTCQNETPFREDGRDVILAGIHHDEVTASDVPKVIKCIEALRSRYQFA